MYTFEPGDRVVIHRYYTGLISGTVIKTKIIGAVLPELALYVIFDDGSELTAEASNFWLEDEYDPDRPF